ncbi:NAD(P)-dependent dehydrogenase (short-subunit alcohol dehydrogenase family) [Pseudonocardia sediminis]|uniref:NAD(P)-dependent dehydrogenase (Short-subunit alcohol dehydrogenase family) n=1 Tax=Pseudonocardia sediminis TaxID=1397368 RepID=A0A4Q7V860_PSEST|nr:SDR family oxidoreductase [Pseudonocardia sediminis]RZT88979.1 NAD(P)-dependent dehydrogenase (short-subunit alcohol dehydrogenase family) [Pseudonocardia sediminis]
MTRFDGHVALVTGGASGIGAAIGSRLRGEGAHVVLADIDADGLARAAAADPDVATVACDVTDSAAVEAAVAETVRRFGRIDSAFAVAGAARFGTITDIAEDDWTFTVDLVLRGTFLTVRHAARAMRAAGHGGAVVIVSSLNAHVPLYGGSSYAAAKAASENFAKSAALELAPHGIRVNAVLPGLVATPLTAPLLGVESVNADYLARIPARRAADPSEIAGPCLYLASDDASYVNGTSLVVDGGWEITNYPDLAPLLEG